MQKLGPSESHKTVECFADVWGEGVGIGSASMQEASEEDDVFSLGIMETTALRHSCKILIPSFHQDQ